MSNLIPIAIDLETSSESGTKEDNLNFLKNKIECVAVVNSQETRVRDLREFPLVVDPPTGYLCVMHNAMFDLKVLAHHYKWSEEDIMNCHIFDTYVAARLIDENDDCGLKDLAKKYLGKDRSGDTFKIKSSETRENFLDYCKRDAEDTFSLFSIFKKELENQGLLELFNLEMEVVKKMICAELRGVRLDIPKMERLQKRFAKNRDKLRRCFLTKYLLSEDFNMNSPKQLQKLFFQQLELTPKKTTLKGSPSTSAAALEEMALEGVDAARWLLTFRKYEMVERQTVKLIESAHEGRVHPNFNIVGTESGRFSCARPNLQQIAGKSTMGIAIRNCFIGDLVVADFDNIEMRLLAHFSQEPKLLQAYKQGEEIDVHQQTADLLKISRSSAKTINFGILYGIGKRKLAQSLKIDEDEAQELINSWNRNYPMVQRWKDKVIYEASLRGYVTSLSGRRRHVPELIGCLTFQKRDRDQLRLLYGLQREVVNFVLQGSSADLTKKALVELKDENLVCTIHDEFIWENPKRSVEEFEAILNNLVDLSVPITCTVQRVKSWGLAKSKPKKELQNVQFVV